MMQTQTLDIQIPKRYCGTVCYYSSACGYFTCPDGCYHDGVIYLNGHILSRKLSSKAIINTIIHESLHYVFDTIGEKSNFDVKMWYYVEKWLGWREE